MRFLFLTQYFPPEIGGPQTRLRSVAQHLLEAGHEVEVVTSLPNYPRGKFFAGYEHRFYMRETLQGVPVHRVWLYPALGGGFGRILNYLSFTLTCIFGLLRSHRPDFLFVESPPLTLSIPAWLFSRIWRIPFVFNVADLWPDAIVDTGFLKDGLALRVLRALENFSYRSAASVTAVTAGIRQSLLSKGVAASKVSYLPNGADTAQFRPAAPDLELKRRLGLDGKRVILWAGTLGFAHGLQFVLQAAKRLTGSPEIHFLFVGDGSAKSELQQLAADLALSNATFLDPVQLDELPAYFSIAECGLASLKRAPTHEGARPSKIFPVLASGKPLIFVGSGECARLIQEADAGIVVPPEEPEMLAAAIQEFFANQTRVVACGRNGRRFVEKYFAWPVLIEAWLASLAHHAPASLALPGPERVAPRYPS